MKYHHYQSVGLTHAYLKYKPGPIINCKTQKIRKNPKCAMNKCKNRVTFSWHLICDDCYKKSTILR